MHREVIQWLESFQQAGVSSWPRTLAVRPPSVSSRATESQHTAPLRPEAVVQVESEVHKAGGRIPASSDIVSSSQEQLMAKKPSPLSLLAGRCETFKPMNLAESDRVTALDRLKQVVAGCVRCRELAATRTQTVFGTGNPQAKILFIGEAPGADEDATGEPFVGRAGQLLNDIIKACRLTREEIYICNILRCRPPGNRLPSFEEAENCREYLDGQIAVVNPEYIVCWGSCAAKNLLGSDEAIGKMRSRFYRYGTAKVLCTYHPSYLLRNPAAKKDVWEDMKYLFRDMGINLTKS